MYKKNHCSPIGIINTNSCLSDELLKKIAININNNKECENINYNNNENLYNDICNRINKISNCENEKCWLTLNKITDDLSHSDKVLFKESFKPFVPKGWIKEPNMWLNTSDIDNVLNRYQKRYPEFKYFGALPIDFDKKKKKECLISDLCKINIKNLLHKNYKSIGIVFNTDPHNKDGEHWFSIYVDLIGINRNQPTIYYYDSALNPIQKEIKKLIKKIKSQFKKLNQNIDFLFNDIQHQSGDTECGVYCIHFLVQMLKGKKFQDYLNQKLNDKKIEKFRKIFFIPPE